MREIYLDNSATTRTAEPAARAVYDMLVSCYGNPSSLHRKGLEAENRITEARRRVSSTRRYRSPASPGRLVTLAATAEDRSSTSTRSPRAIMGYRP